MLNVTEASPKTVVMDNPVGLNTLYQRPIAFWAYNGTVANGDCSKKVLRIILKQRSMNSESDMDFYHLYLKNLTGSETSTRTVMNPNNIDVFYCGEECDDSLRDLLWSMAIYTLVLFFTLYQT